MSRANSELRIELDRPPPDPLRVGGGTAFFVSGALAGLSPPPRHVDLELAGVRTRATVAGDRFWAIVPVPVIAEPRREALLARVMYRGGSGTEANLGPFQLEPGPRPEVRGGDERFVAICMATYEPPQELFRHQIATIREQTHERWTCVISDDASSEDSLRLIRETIGGDERFRLVENERRLGFFHNFERAIQAAPPEAGFLALADQDDRWHPDKLARLLGAIGEAAIAYSDARIVDATGAVISPTYWSERPNRTDDLVSLLLANTVTGAAALYRRDTVERALPFPPQIARSFHDHWLALVGRASGEIAYVDRPLYDYVQHEAAELGHEAAQAWARPKRGLLARLRHFRADRDYFYDHWRTTYFTEYCRAALLAQVLLMRVPELPARERRRLARLRDADGSAVGTAWLALRRIKRLVGENETLGAEGRLLRALLWRLRAPASSEHSVLPLG